MSQRAIEAGGGEGEEEGKRGGESLHGVVVGGSGGAINPVTHSIFDILALISDFHSYFFCIDLFIAFLLVMAASVQHSRQRCANLRRPLVAAPDAD